MILNVSTLGPVAVLLVGIFLAFLMSRLKDDGPVGKDM